MSKSEIEELRNNFLNELSTKGNDSIHPKDLERVKTDDDWLRRFLLHQEKNVQNAVNMMWVSLNWRKENNVNDISEETVKMDILCSGAFFPHGTDIDGCVLLIFKCKRNLKGGGADQNEIRRCVLYWFERLERQTKGKQISIFFDMEGCGLSNMDMDFIKYLIGLFKEYYPYFLNYIIIFEMAWVLTAAFKIVKSWLPEKAIEKIKFLGKKDITTFVPRDQALKCWGGDNEYSFSFIPEVVPEKEKSVTGTTTNNKKVHFVDGSMSEVSAGSIEKDTDGGALKVTPSGIITFVKDGSELVSTLELHNSDSSSHISYKLKTTSPEKFRVKPSTGCLAPGETAIVTVTLLHGFQLGGLSRDKFLVMSTQIESSDVNNIDVSELWKNTSGRKINQHRLKCIQSGEAMKNGGSLTTIPNVQESDHQYHYKELTASVAKLNSCQAELHKAIKTTQYYQFATIFLVILLGVFISLILKSSLKEITSNHSTCTIDNYP